MSQSAGAAPLCRRTPNRGTSKAPLSLTPFLIGWEEGIDGKTFVVASHQDWPSEKWDLVVNDHCRTRRRCGNRSGLMKSIEDIRIEGADANGHGRIGLNVTGFQIPCAWQRQIRRVLQFVSDSDLAEEH